MKRIFLDTNIILDLLIRDEYKSQIRELISLCHNIDLFISYLSIANAAYIMRKYPKEEIFENINLLLELFDVIPNDKNQIKKALLTDGSDFEDILQYQSAKWAKCDVILTRNAKDFSFSDIPLMTVTEFLNIISNP